MYAYTQQQGRALARLAVLLRCTPPREAERRFCAVGPRSRTGARACRALARHRTTGARALGYLAPGGVPFFQVTRCKSETVSGHHRNIGYVHQKENGRLSGRHRWQASSHRGMCTPERKWSAVRPRSLAGQLPQGERVHQKKMVGHKAVFAGKPAPTGTAPTRKKHASHEAAIASKPAHKGIRS
jgi:hypothetical protein